MDQHERRPVATFPFIPRKRETLDVKDLGKFVSNVSNAEDSALID